MLARARSRIFELTRESLAETEDLAERMIAADASQSAHHQLLAAALAYQCFLGFAADWRDRLDRANAAIHRAVALDDRSEFNHMVDGTVAYLRREHRRAVVAFERALEINPHFTYATANLGMAHAWAGNADETIRLAEAAIAAYPRDPVIFLRQFTVALGHFLAGRHAEALAWVLRSLQLRREQLPAQLLRIACCGALGEGGTAAIAELGEVFPELAGDSLERLPFVHAEDRAAFAEGLTRAGMPLPR
jgi:tetratricopeptide (TPR) repeat protein